MNKIRSHKHNKYFSILKKILPFIGILIGICLIFYPWISEYLYENRVDGLIETYEAQASAIDNSEKDKLLEEAQAYNKELLNSSVKLTDPFKDILGESVLDNYYTTLSLDDSGLMGSIEIPKIKVNLPIYHGTSDEVLQHGIGHLVQTSLPVGGESTHCVLSGHTGLNTAKLFTDLTSMEEGDLFFLHVLGDTLAYKVYSISVIEPTETSKLTIQKGKDLCTLLTCTPYGVNSHRLVVTGIRTDYSEEVYEEASNDVAEVDSEWMKQYTKSIIIGLVVVAILFILIIIVKSVKKFKNRFSKESDYIHDEYSIPLGAQSRKVEKEDTK